MRPFLHVKDGAPARGDTRTMRRRPPCRNFGGDARSRELSDRIHQRARAISGVQRELLRDIAELDRAEAWRGDGAISMTAWVTDRCRVSTSTAKQWVIAAARLESLPCLSEGLASGDLSLDLVSVLAEVATSETDAELRQEATHWTVRQAREIAAWRKAQREAGAEHKESDQREDQSAESSTGPGGTDESQGGSSGAAAREFERRTLRFNDTRRTVWIGFTKDDYSRFKSVMVARAAAEKRAAEMVERVERQHQEYVPYDQRLYDALMHVIDRGARPDGVAGGLGSDSSKKGHPSTDSVEHEPGFEETSDRSHVAQSLSRDWWRPRMVIHAPLELLVELAGETDAGVAEIAGLGPVEIEVVRRLACDAKIDLLVESREGCVLDQGRLRRDPTTAQRIEIARRDKGCRFPGCVYTEFTNVHHIRHWVNGGETNLDNLVTLCDRHHKAVHELGWSLVGDPNEVLSFSSPHGRVMNSVPSPTWRHMTRRRGSTSAERSSQPRRE
jgi:hypothetical protein